MYCINCGTKIEGNYCPNCGQKSGSINKSNVGYSNNLSVFKLDKKTSIYLNIGISVVLLYMLFQKLLMIPLLNSLVSEMSNNIIDAGKLSFLDVITNLPDLIEYLSKNSQVVLLILMILTVIWIVSIYKLLRFAYASFTHSSNCYSSGKSAMNSLVVLFILLFILTLLGNLIAKQETGGYVRDIFALTQTSYFIGIIAFVYRVFFIPRIDGLFRTDNTQTVRNAPVKEKTMENDKSEAIIFEDDSFCYHCGAEIEKFQTQCPICKKELA